MKQFAAVLGLAVSMFGSGCDGVASPEDPLFDDGVPKVLQSGTYEVSEYALVMDTCEFLFDASSVNGRQVVLSAAEFTTRLEGIFEVEMTRDANQLIGSENEAVDVAGTDGACVLKAQSVYTGTVAADNQVKLVRDYELVLDGPGCASLADRGMQSCRAVFSMNLSRI